VCRVRQTITQTRKSKKQKKPNSQKKGMSFKQGKGPAVEGSSRMPGLAHKAAIGHCTRHEALRQCSRHGSTPKLDRPKGLTALTSLVRPMPSSAARSAAASQSRRLKMNHMAGSMSRSARRRIVSSRRGTRFHLGSLPAAAAASRSSSSQAPRLPDPQKPQVLSVHTPKIHPKDAPCRCRSEPRAKAHPNARDAGPAFPWSAQHVAKDM
jgi:hypothetical protein